MAILRMRLRLAALLGLVAVGIPMFGALLATPAAAFGFGFHGGAASPMFARRQMAPSVAMPANRGVARLQSRQQVPSTATVSSTSAAARSMRARSFASKSAGTKSAESKTPHISGDICKKTGACITIPKANNDISPGGPSTAATQSSSLSQGGAAGGSALPGGGAVGGGNGPSGLAATPPSSSGGGPGQFTTAGAPANDPAGTRSLNGPGSNRPSSGGASATKTETAPNTTTQNTTKGNMAAPSTTTTTLTAVTVCMTRAGSCPMERDIGTACQCKDARGNVYDGNVK